MKINNNNYPFSICFVLLLIISSVGCSESSISPPPKEEFEIPRSVIERISEDELLELVQKQTFSYFWEFADATSGMAKESPKNAVITIGGSGFGISCYPIAVERGWITKNEAIVRMRKVLTFLEDVAKYHGAFAHWYNSSGTTAPFSPQDNGGDIVETALLFQGLLINRQYFSSDNTEENDIRDRITTLWEAVEWDWYTQGDKSITWHWSPNYGFALNLTVNGWNEALIAYVLAAASPKHSIDKETYENGWGRNGNMRNTGTFYEHLLTLGEDFGGPLFFSQYSFIGLDPRGLVDQYANYFEQNEAHSLINYEYCKDNPKGFKGYSENSWGLTASDNKDGYAVHSPTNDLGVITPTAALSSFPYTPEESKAALEYFYYELNDNLWGEYGFYDAFSENYDWYADSYLAVDQGPIIAMIENYRTQLLWNLFMQDADVKLGLQKLGFTSPKI